MELNDKELQFLKTLKEFEGNHTSDRHLRDKLHEHGIEDEEYTIIKRKLIFGGYIGSVYGNIILEKKEFK